MALKNQVPNVYSVGLQNVGSYQVAGQPYLSGSTTSATLGYNVDGYYVFPTVTQRVVITNNDSSNDAIVSFAPFLDTQKSVYGYSNSASGSGNWLSLKAGKSIDLDVKCKEIFVAPAAAVAVNNITIYSELTNIPVDRMYSLDGVEGITNYVAPAAAGTNGLTNQVPNVYSVGLQNVGSYQVSGQPYLTGSNISTAENSILQNVETSVNFPKTTKSLTLWNFSDSAQAKLRVTFAATASMTNYPANGCYYEVAQNESVTLNIKCKKVYLSAIAADVKWKLYSSLTNIPSERMYDLTGSGISE